MFRIRVWAAAAAFVALASCGAREADLGPVTSREQALAVARARLGEEIIKGRPLEVTQDAESWTVRIVRGADDPGETSLIIAKTGRTVKYLDDVTDVAIIKPAN